MVSNPSNSISKNPALAKIAGVIHPYPTRAEGIKAVANAYMRTRLTPGIKRLFERVLAWRR